jgi:predicted N-formylglutamate amidohydrolase
MNELPKKLLAADEPAPVTVYNADGESPFVLVADHLGNIMPRALGHLGIAEAESLFAWPVGSLAIHCDRAHLSKYQSNLSRPL